MSEMVLITTPEPKFVPGYTGYCPQFRYRSGGNYGNMTHKLLLDKEIQHADRLVLSDYSKEYAQGFLPTDEDIAIVESRERYTDPLFRHVIVPGYAGDIPGASKIIGANQSIAGVQGLANFERLQYRSRKELEFMRTRLKLQAGSGGPRNLDDRIATTNEYRLPLLEVNKAMQGVRRGPPPPRPPLILPPHSDMPPFMCEDDPEKYYIPGTMVHVPYLESNIGYTYADGTHKALGDFIRNYERNRSLEWQHVVPQREPLPCKENEDIIYHRCYGLVPSYMGHIPGAEYRVGKTFGNDSIDAKRWLRGDFSP